MAITIKIVMTRIILIIVITIVIGIVEILVVVIINKRVLLRIVVVIVIVPSCLWRLPRAKTRLSRAVNLMFFFLGG